MKNVPLEIVSLRLSELSANLTDPSTQVTKQSNIVVLDHKQIQKVVLTFTVNSNIIEVTMVYIISEIACTMIKGAFPATTVKAVNHRTRTLAIVR